MANTHGFSEPAFSPIRDLLQQHITDKSELGASVCVNIDGKNVLDIWGGYTDAARTKAWEKNTIGPVWSCTKVVSSLAALILIDRGLLDPKERVSKYWSEFAVNGKEDVKVSHILSHTSGLSGWDQPVVAEDVYDTAKATERLASQAPWWTPGSQSGYHAITHGFLIGELVRRISGKSVGQFIADEIAGPLGADFQLGAEEKDWPRTADITPPPPPAKMGALDPNSVAAKTYTGPKTGAEVAMNREFRTAQLGGSNGFSNARALARIGSLVSLGGTVDGKQYLSPGAIEKLIEEQISGPDLVLFHHLRFGLGVGLPVPQTVPWIPAGKLCFWSGWGGSILIMDLERRMTIAYSLNKMNGGTMGNERTEAYVRKVYEVVDGYLRDVAV